MELAGKVAEVWRESSEREVTRVMAPPPELTGSEPLFDRPLELAGPPTPDEAGGEDVVELRARIRERLLWLKQRLADILSARDAYYVLFPIVVYVDEMILLATDGQASAWLPLQVGLFEIDDGGERFYSTLDALFDREETDPLIFETFYFCLKDGFRGQYAGNPDKVDEYLQRLKARIPTSSMDEWAVAEENFSPVELLEFPRQYYLLAGGVVLGALLLFFVLGRLSAGSVG